MKNLLILLVVLLFSVNLNAQNSPGKNHSGLNINCKTCHTCDVPTKDDPCLVICPREKIATVYQKPEETPELIVIKELGDRYNEVNFSHKIHAQMSVMSGGCENCHHHNTSGPILKCNSCHEPNRKRENVSLPDLKGAYHRQCMDCHREWSHETGCNSCHSLKSSGNGNKQQQVKNKISGKSHPVIIEPTKLVYQTSYLKGKIVTFFHDDHTKKFGLSCTSCHKQESCTKCHDVNNASNSGVKNISSKKSVEEHHKKCFSCHKEDNCESCHLSKEAESFDHGKQTGWALNKNHINLSCSKCHGAKLPYKKLDNKCFSCHKNWNADNFKHSVTGLQLDETHSGFGCEDCHLESNFAVKPSCTNCHDDFVYPKQKPGKMVR